MGSKTRPRQRDQFADALHLVQTAQAGEENVAPLFWQERFRLWSLAVTPLFSLHTAYENGQIQQKANSKVLMDYGPLDEVLKTRRPK